VIVIICGGGNRIELATNRLYYHATQIASPPSAEGWCRNDKSSHV
jgi:hypothetical protein